MIADCRKQLQDASEDYVPMLKYIKLQEVLPSLYVSQAPVQNAKMLEWCRSD